MEPYQIAFFGAANSGKSTLVNAIAGQTVSLVSELPGTTTDPVRKRMELPKIGPCVLVDTAGYGDDGELGQRRELLSRSVIDSTDLAVLILSGHKSDKEWESLLRKSGVTVVTVQEGTPKDNVLALIIESVPPREEKTIVGNLVKEGSVVLLVMPQDSGAPKGRIILPQVQVIRELLDRGCIPHCCTPDSMEGAIKSLRALPDLVITDSQVFARVNASIPHQVPLTSFSILLSSAKGDSETFISGAKAIGYLKPGARVLIAEACTHVPDSEDIGRVKIPGLLKKRVQGLQVDVAAGNDFPGDLSEYDLIIHCGACVATAALVSSRIRKATLAGVPITNYGMAIAALQGILDRVSIP